MISLLKDISIYTIGDILTKGIAFFGIIFYSHFITQHDMGIYGYILVVIGFINTFLMLGLDNAYARYFFEYKNARERSTLTTTIIFFLIFWSVFVVSISSFFVGDIVFVLLKTYEYNGVFLVAIAGIPLRIISSVLNQALRNQFKTQQFVIFNFFSTLLTIIFALILLFLKFGLISIFIALIASDIIVLPFKFFAIRNLLSFRINIGILRKLLSFGIPFLPSSIAYWIYSSSDRIMLERMSALEDLGVYTVAVSLSSVMAIVCNSIAQAWSPHAIQIYEEDQYAAKKFYVKFLNLLLFLFLFVMFFACIFGKDFIMIAFPYDYEKAFYPFLILMTSLGFQVTTQVTAIGISLSKKTMYFLYVSFFVAFVNVFLNFALIPYYGVYGAAFATAISYLLLTLIYAMISQRLFFLNYDYGIILIFCVLLLIVFCISFLSFLYKIVVFCFIVIMVYAKRERIIKVFKDEF